jgi:hypothetical protein
MIPAMNTFTEIMDALNDVSICVAEYGWDDSTAEILCDTMCTAMETELSPEERVTVADFLREM